MTSAGGMTPGTRMRKACEQRLCALVPADEKILAVGTAEYLDSLGPDMGSGGGWTFIVVTSTRVLFAPWRSPEKPHEEIRFEDVLSWSSGTQYNCHAIVLWHRPISRHRRVPAVKILWFEWGNAEAEILRSQTIFRFSRPDAKVAKAIRSVLEERNVPHEVVRFEEVSREERTRGSHAVLHAEER